MENLPLIRAAYLGELWFLVQPGNILEALPPRWEAVRMTQQYIAGELSVFLARTQAVATNRAALDAAVELRHAAETVPVSALTFVVVRALGLLDGLCWESLERGDTTAFVHQAMLGTELQQFGTCAGLLPEE